MTIAMILIGLCYSLSAQGSGFDALQTGHALYAIVGDGTQLLRLDEDGTSYQILDTGEEIRCLAALGEDVYYLCKNGSWEVRVARADGAIDTVLAFAEGSQADGLTAEDGSLLLLLNHQLRILYPTSGVCLLYLSQRMTEYTVIGEYVYYCSDDDRLTYTDSSGKSATAGCLYRANLKTGNSAVLLKIGVDSLCNAGSTLYFRNYSDSVVMEDALVGLYYSFRLEEEVLSQIPNLLDVYPVGDLALLRTAQGLMNGDCLLLTPQKGELLASAGPCIALWNQENHTMTLVSPDGAKRSYDVKTPTTRPTPSPSASPAPRSTTSDDWVTQYHGDADYDIYDDESYK